MCFSKAIDTTETFFKNKTHHSISVCLSTISSCLVEFILKASYIRFLAVDEHLSVIPLTLNLPAVPILSFWSHFPCLRLCKSPHCWFPCPQTVLCWSQRLCLVPVWCSVMFGAATKHDYSRQYI